MLKDLLIFIRKNFVLKLMKVNVFADTICGWCFIGHRNLNTALKKFPNVKFDIKHIPFQLNPDMPTEGILRDKYLEIKFGGKDYAAPMYENMRLKANESGINLNLDKIKKVDPRNSFIVLSLLMAFYTGFRMPNLWSVNYYIPSMFEGF